MCVWITDQHFSARPPAVLASLWPRLMATYEAAAQSEALVLFIELSILVFFSLRSFDANTELKHTYSEHHV